MATIYYNSIELEWKPGGSSDVLHYNIQYRQYTRRGFDTEIYSANYDQSNIETNYHLTDFSEDENAQEDRFVSINTTSTRFKVDNTLKPYHFYEFKVAALNGQGKSDDTNTLRVRTAATSKLQPRIKFLILVKHCGCKEFFYFEFVALLQKHDFLGIVSSRSMYS